jgi:hypothetical protein
MPMTESLLCVRRHVLASATFARPPNYARPGILR